HDNFRLIEFGSFARTLTVVAYFPRLAELCSHSLPPSRLQKLKNHKPHFDPPAPVVLFNHLLTIFLFLKSCFGAPIMIRFFLYFLGSPTRNLTASRSTRSTKSTRSIRTALLLAALLDKLDHSNLVY